MLIPEQEICRVVINSNLTRNNLSVVILGTETHSYSIGDYFPKTNQVHFYGAKLTKKQIDKIFELLNEEFISYCPHGAEVGKCEHRDNINCNKI